MRLFERLQARTNAAPAGLGLSNLSGREIEILMLVARGRRNSEIAEELVISPHTVRNHISNILAKLQMANRVEAAAYAIKHGVV
jgi:DNA-binding NarL/FixJ family response regulator